MKKFILKLFNFFLIGGIPLLILAIGYLLNDPFKILYPYDDYSNLNIIPNRDYISTTMFDKNKDVYKYNSFIFGSSRTVAFRPSEWKKHLRDSSSVFLFDAPGESLYGIYTKIKYLQSNNVKLDNALVILCRDWSFEENENFKGHLYVHHPHTVKTSKIEYHLIFFKAYLSPKFLLAFYVNKITGKFYGWMRGYIEKQPVFYDPITNEARVYIEKEISKNPEKYYSSKDNIFYNREVLESQDKKERIKEKHLLMLKEIKQIFRKHKTRYSIIISPLYDQIKINKKDKEKLELLFENNLYDFTGKNLFTDDKHNYYETSHYRPNVGNDIFKIIYKN